ncbi:MAG: 30S ribosomal protein S16 [Patescibacteria group bacterium]
MLRIRLSQTGKKHDRKYRIVVGPQRSKRDGKIVANLGFWDPRENKLSLDMIAYAEWIKKGAQPADSVQKLAQKVTQ